METNHFTEHLHLHLHLIVSYTRNADETWTELRESSLIDKYDRLTLAFSFSIYDRIGLTRTRKTMINKTTWEFLSNRAGIQFWSWNIVDHDLENLENLEHLLRVRPFFFFFERVT